MFTKLSSEFPPGQVDFGVAQSGELHLSLGEHAAQVISLDFFPLFRKRRNKISMLLTTVMILLVYRMESGELVRCLLSYGLCGK